jgi:hypothetical protein
MKRIALTIVAGAFGTLLVLPMAHAQEMQDNSASTVQSEQKTTDTTSNFGPAGVASHQQVDVQKRSDVQSGGLGEATHKQVSIEKHSDVENNGFGSSTENQVDVQKRSDVQSDGLGTSTHQQVVIQKHSDNVNPATTFPVNQ